MSLSANAAAKAMGTAAQQAKTLASAMRSAQAAATKAQAMSDVTGLRKASAAYSQLSEQLDVVKAGMGESSVATFGAEGTLAELGVTAGAVAASVAAAAVAVVALGVALYEGAKVAIDASENLRRMNAVFDALGASAGHSGARTIGMLRELEKQIPENEATVSAWARTLEAAGVTDLTQLKASLLAVAAAESLVEGGGDKVKNLLAKLNEQAAKGGGKVKFSLAALAGTGVTETEFMTAIGMTPANFTAAKKAGTLTGKAVSDAIVKALATKATGPLAAQMNDLATIEAKAADGMRRLFEDVDTGPLIAGVKAFFGLFDAGTPSGDLMKTVLTGAFNAVMGIAGTVFEFLRQGFLRTAIAALETAIYIKRHQTVFEGLAAVLAGVVVGAIVAMTVAMWSFAASAAAAAVGVIAATWPFLAIGAAIGLVIFGIYKLVQYWPQISTFFGNLVDGAVHAANAFIHGLADGIMNGAQFAIRAVEHLGSVVIAAIRRILGVHSPSKIMFEIGATGLAGGLAGGVRAGTPEVESAATSMGGAAVAAVPQGGRSSAAAAGAGDTTIQFGGITVIIDGSHASSAAELRGIVEEEFASLAERLALMIGSAPTPA